MIPPSQLAEQQAAFRERQALRKSQAAKRAAKRKPIEARKLKRYLNSKKYTADLIRLVKYSMLQWGEED
jgi:hypothetical protein